MRTLSWILILAVCFVSGGATCMRRETPMPYPPAPAVLNETPSANDVVAAVNRTSSINQLSTNSATVEVLSMPALPKLTSTTINLQRNKNFRMLAKIPILLGSGMDMGSNDQVFWFEIPEGVSRTLYFASHEQYQQKLNRSILPVDPSWVMDALGLVQIDPASIVAGPVPRPDGTLEIRSTIPMPTGAYQRVCLIDAAGGFVTHQLLYAPTGNLVASSEATKHRYYEQANCVLPHRVKVSLQPASGPPLTMQIDVGSYTINQLLTGDPNVFTMPQTASNAVDLTKLNMTVPVSSATPPIPAARGAAATIGPKTGPIHYTSSNRLGPMPLRGTVRTVR